MQSTDRALVERFFTRSGMPPLDSVTWEKRDASITDSSGKVFFEQKDCEFPAGWSQTAVNVVASKYFKGPMGTPKRESSVRQLIKRVTSEISDYGLTHGYFQGVHESLGFEQELQHLLVNQMACFNSPVWFNVGVKDERSAGWCWDESLPNYPGNPEGGIRQVQQGEHRPQCSACFIVAPEDNMESILDWVKTEGLIFKFGSGSGANVSKLRSSKEILSGGGRPSGPLAFMQINDQAAGSIKSGGKHRRAAKMVELDVNHPDILDFIRSKAKEEEKIRKLVEAGWKNSLDDPDSAQAAAFFQNENHSVSASEDFMCSVVDGAPFKLLAVTDGRTIENVWAQDIMREIAEATWKCGDPGMQFNGTMNKWNTVKGSGRIRGSNPCSEYMFLDDSSCNLASLNLMRFFDADGTFALAAFRHAVHVMIVAQEILVDMGSYPTKAIAQNSHDFRPLGLGVANLGAFLMARGLAYDSDEGRHTAASITALMTGQAYLTSSMLAERVGPFPRWEENVTSMREVMGMHEEAARSLKLDYISREALDIWRMVNGPTSRTFRNAQTTVMAPTGTIGFMMDCDTTGIEPMLGLKVFKKLVGGGVMEITPACVEEGLRRLNYRETYPRILAYVKEKGTLEGCPGFKEEHLPVFDTSFPSGPSKRSIHYMGHIKMMAAIQPFLSGAISKTVNMPETATVEDIEDAYLQAWKLGLKAIAIYRDGSKNIQPLTTKKEVPQADDLVRAKLAEVPDFAAIEAKVCGIIHELAKLPPEERRAKIRQEYAALFGTVDPVGLLDSGCHQKLTGDRMALVHEFRINGHKAYLTVGMYPDGRPAEIFVDMAKEGSTISGLLDAWAISVSFNLQHNVPLRKLVDKFAHTKFDPAGWTDNPDIKTCDSVVDYIVRWLELKFLKPKEQQQMADEGSIFRQAAAAAATMSRIPDPPGSVRIQDEVILNADAPCCADCGSIMVRNGSCFKCGNCGGTSGCS